MKQGELRKVLELHQKWMNYEEGGVRANLNDADLSGLDLRGIDLSGAGVIRVNLHGADLRKAYLGGCNLRQADLSCANLQGAIFYGANLSDANLRESNLDGADLFGANLLLANMQEASMVKTDLFEANLKRANLKGANLKDANIRGVNLWAVNFRGAKNIPYIPLACPEKGEFIAFSRCGEYIVELLIPAHAKRFSATTRKCRADYAKVLSITKLSGEPAELDSVTDTEDCSNVIYKVGEFVFPNYFKDDRWDMESNGIYFFLNRQEAVGY